MSAAKRKKSSDQPELPIDGQVPEKTKPAKADENGNGHVLAEEVPVIEHRPFEPGKDYVVRETKAGGGYVVAFGESVYRALDAVINLQEAGVAVGLVNKPTVNMVDADMMKKLAAAPFVLVVEAWNVKTGLGSRFGSYLLQAGFKGKYNHLGTHIEGSGGLWQQMGHQGLDSEGIQAAIKALL